MTNIYELEMIALQRMAETARTAQHPRGKVVRKHRRVSFHRPTRTRVD